MGAARSGHPTAYHTKIAGQYIATEHGTAGQRITAEQSTENRYIATEYSTADQRSSAMRVVAT